MITLGDTVMVVQRNGTERPRHLWGHGYFEARLEDECVRAAHEPRAFSDPPHAAGAAGAGGRGRAALRRAAAAARRGRDVRAGRVRDAARRARAERVHAGIVELRHRLAPRRASGDGGTGQLSRDGRTPEALVEVAGARARGQAPARRSAAPGAGRDRALLPLVERIAGGTINVLHPRRDRRRQGGARRDHPPAVAARQDAVPAPQLRGAVRDAARERAVRSREGRLHRRADAEAGAARDGATAAPCFSTSSARCRWRSQAKLLRVIEERKVLRVGALKPRDIDVRFIAATNRDLEAEAARGRFRADLYFRLNGISLTLPPLRERARRDRAAGARVRGAGVPAAPPGSATRRASRRRR